MIRIAVCDDRSKELNKVLKMVEGYAALRPRYEIAAEAFSSPFVLLSQVEAGYFHDIYLLDILMPDLSGIELGRCIRKRNDACAILFSTVTSEYALDAFQIQAQNYLVKPFREEALHAALDRALRSLVDERVRGIAFRTPEGQVFLPFHQIVYIELVERRMEFHRTNGTVARSLVLRGSFEEALADLLTEPRFLQTHKSFVVNMDHVHMRAGFHMTLADGASVPMAPNRQAGALEHYVNYLSGRRSAQARA